MNLRLGLNKNMKGKSINAFSAAQNQQFGTSNISELASGDGWQRMLFLYKKQVDVIFYAKIDTKNASIDCFV